MKQYEKSFKNWKTQELEKVFGIERSEDKTKLIAWENSSCEITEKERVEITSLQNDLIEKVEYWNEATFKFFFLGPFIRLVRYETAKYSSFLEHTLKLKVTNDITISGNVDFLVATGYQIPEVPFFTLHEYKADLNARLDPAGQLLVSMIAAQRANEVERIKHPLYGVYVVGRLWFFVILEGKSYIKSRAYDSTREDIFTIFRMLRQVKGYIDEVVNKMPL